MSEIPRPLVKTPRLISKAGIQAEEWRWGRGFSVGEIKAAGLTVKDAALLGLPVDKRRRTVWDVNVKSIKTWLLRVLRGDVKPPDPALTKVVKIKRKRGRVFRGLTPAGRRSRGLMSVKLKETHRHKWKKKARERMLKKRHEEVRAKGGH